MDDLAAAWDRVTVPDAAGAVVRQIEQFRAAPYQDSGGVWTIGYGSTHLPDGTPVTAATAPVDEPTARAWQTADMADAAADVADQVMIPLRNREAAALISFVYNAGEGNFDASTLLRDLDAVNLTDVPAQFRRWVYAGAVPLLGLLRRRWAEAAIFVGVAPDLAVSRAWNEIDGLGIWPAFGVVNDG